MQSDQDSKSNDEVANETDPDQSESSKLSVNNNAFLETPSHSRIRLSTNVSPIGKKSGLLLPRAKINERSLSSSSHQSISLIEQNHHKDDVDDEMNTKSTIALSKDVQGIGNLTPSQELEIEALHNNSINGKDDNSSSERVLPIMTVYSGNSSPATERSRSPIKTRIRKGKQEDLIESDTEEHTEMQRSTTSLQKQKDGVDFLTKRLRSAIGQEILSSEQGDEQQNDKTKSKLSDGNKSERSSQMTNSTDSSSSKTLGGGGGGGGWGWSTLTNLPATLRIDQALQSLSFQGGNDEDASSTSKTNHNKANQETNTIGKSTKNESGPFASAGGTLTAGLMTAVDPRNWFGANEDKGEAVALQKENKKTTSTSTSSTRNIPTGSFPSSSSVKSKKTKERESARKKAQEIEHAAAAVAAAEREKRQAGSKVEEHDLQDKHFGILDEDLSRYGGERYPEHEYMIMSTAGKPIFWSKISKARLMRSKQNRQRKRDKQASLDSRKAVGDDITKDSEDFRIREEGLSKEEQSIQDEEDQLEATRVGVLQAIISNYAETDKVKLHETSAEVLELPSTGRTAFLLRPPLYLIAVSHWDEAETTLRNHLEYLYQAIISLVSAVKLKLLFDRAANFDLKRLLQGTDSILDSLLTGLQLETIAMRGALQPLRMNAAIRHDVGTSLIPTRNKESRPQDALYALLLTRNGIITLARRKKHSIHPIDCHLLVNTVLSTNALKEGGTQSWVPICLPKFAPQGFMYAHVSFLDNDEEKESNDRQTDLGLVLVTGNPDGFEDMSMWRERIVKQLKENEMLTNLLQTARNTLKDEDQEEEEEKDKFDSIRYSADELGIPGLRHFCFKWRSNVQSTSPRFEDPYLPGTDDHHRLLYLYGIAHENVVKSVKENSKKSNKSSNVSPALSDTESILRSNKGKKREEGEGGETDDSSSIHTTNTIERKNKTPSISRSNKFEVKADSRTPTRSSSPPIIPRSVLQSNRQNSSSSTTTTSVGGGATSTAANLLKQTIGGIGFDNQTRSSTTFTHLIRTRQEAVLAWSTPPFELYICASPHLPKIALIAMAKSIVKWVKQEEHQLFIVSAPIF